MTADSTSAPLPSNPAIAQALEAIRAYKRGGSRGALLASDRAVSIAIKDPKAREALEEGLVSLLAQDLSQEAAEHACRQLGVIGTGAAASRLIALFRKPALLTAVCGALDAIRDTATDSALRGALPKATGLVRGALVDLVGRRRDQRAVPLLIALLRAKEAPLRSAAARALGMIGNGAAARALRQVAMPQERVPGPELIDACLQCAERLPAASRDRRELLAVLSAMPLEARLRDAVRRAGAVKAS